MDVLKNKTLNLNLSLMFITSLAFAYVSANLMVLSGLETAETAYNWGFIIGRALTGVLFPLALVIIPLGLFGSSNRRQLFTKGTYKFWWGLFVMLNAIGMFGSTVAVS